MDAAASPAVPLTLGQLEVRLQLAMAAREQLRASQLVHRAFVHTSMEAYGLELPPHLPANSFTQHPSKTNYLEVLAVMDTQIDAMEQQQRDMTQQERARVLSEIESLRAKLAQQPQSPCVSHWHTALSFWRSPEHEVLRASEEPLVVSELAALDAQIQWWADECFAWGQLLLDPQSVLYHTLATAHAKVPTTGDLQIATHELGTWKYAEPPKAPTLETLVLLVRAIPPEGLPALHAPTLADEQDLQLLHGYQAFLSRLYDMASVRESLYELIRKVLGHLSTLRAFQ